MGFRSPRGRGVITAVLGASLAGQAVVVRAQRSPTDSLHRIALADAIQAALRQNLDVLTAGAALDSAKAEQRIARAFPNPVLAGTPNTPYQYSATLPLDITPQRVYRTRVAASGANAAALDRRDVERQVTAGVSRAFFDALLGEEKLRLAVARRDAVLQILCADSARFHAGDVPERSLTRSEVELVRAEADVARAAADVRLERLAFGASIGIEHPDTALAPSGSLEYRPFDVPVDSMVAIARAHRPDLQASAERVAQSSNAERGAAALLVPTPELAYVRQRTAPFDNGHYYSFGLAFELPSLNLYRGQRERAAAGVTSARLNERRIAAEVERDVLSAIEEFKSQRALVERYRGGLLTKVDQSVDGARYAYSRGAASLLEVLDAVQAQRDVRTDYVTALHDYWVSVYALNASAGVDIVGASR